jgi:hypothetical protein
MAVKFEFCHAARALALGTRLKEHAERFGVGTKIVAILPTTDAQPEFLEPSIQETARSLAGFANTCVGTTLEQSITQLDLIGGPERFRYFR